MGNSLPTKEEFEAKAKERRGGKFCVGFAKCTETELIEKAAYCAMLIQDHELIMFNNIQNITNEQWEAYDRNAVPDKTPVPGLTANETGTHGDFYAVIDIANKKILNWKHPETWIPYCIKVRDGGCYVIYDKDGNELAGYYGDYVPDFFPDEKDGTSHWGDYIRLEVKPNGKILNWKKNKLGDVKKKYKNTKTNAALFFETLARIDSHRAT